MRVVLTAINSINSQSLLIRDCELTEGKYFHIGLASEMKLNPELRDWKINGQPLTPVFLNEDGTVGFSEEASFASSEEVFTSDRCVGSIWEALSEGEILLLRDGCVVLDDELNPSPFPST